MEGIDHSVPSNVGRNEPTTQQPRWRQEKTMKPGEPHIKTLDEFAKKQERIFAGGCDYGIKLDSHETYIGHPITRAARNLSDYADEPTRVESFGDTRSFTRSIFVPIKRDAGRVVGTRYLLSYCETGGVRYFTIETSTETR
jgi:hypothetical protein